MRLLSFHVYLCVWTTAAIVDRQMEDTSSLEQLNVSDSLIELNSLPARLHDLDAFQPVDITFATGDT